VPKPVIFDIETPLAPDVVRAGLLDFTAERPSIWPGLTARLYKIYAVGDTSAEIQEGTAMPGAEVWARERYDWSVPNVVRWTTIESNFSSPQSYVQATFSPGAGGGTRLRIEWNRIGTTFMGKFARVMIVATRGRPVRSSFEMGLKAMAKRAGIDPETAVIR
jgi:hypothetical protein